MNNRYKILVPTDVKELIIEGKPALKIWYRQKIYKKTFATMSTLVTIIDADDWLKIAGYYWVRSTADGYAVRHEGEKRIFMHHEIVGRPPKGLEVDHINRNRLDNRKTNLRIIPRPKNSLNSDRSDNAKHAEKLPSGRWRARLRHNGKDIHLGVFKTKKEAMANAWALKKHRRLSDVIMPKSSYRIDPNAREQIEKALATPGRPSALKIGRQFGVSESTVLNINRTLQGRESRYRFRSLWKD